PPIPTPFPYTTLFRSLATGLRAAPGAGRDQPLLRGTGRGCLLDAQLRSRSERGAERHLLQEPREDERHGGEAHPEQEDAMQSVRSEEHTSELQSLAYL